MSLKKIVIIAGDKSGDLYGGNLSQNLKKKFPAIKIYSFGGRNLADNSEQIIDLVSHSVCGITEVISSIGQILAIFKRSLEEIKKINPDLIILIDFPDFNLRLAKKLNKKYPIFYYVSPQVWAWRRKRVEQIREYITKMIVIFKFEKLFYKKTSIDALYFGHPLLEIIKNVQATTENIISFLPGSRKNEIKHNLPVMIQAKNILNKKLNGYDFQIIKPENIKKEFYTKFSTGINIVDHSYSVIKKSKFIIASSGTATLETAILEVPHLIMYKINPLSWQILKRIVNTKFIGIVNILSSEEIIRELLQNDASAKNIAETTLKYIESEEEYLNLKNKLLKIKTLLEPYKAIEKFADFVGGYLGLTQKI